ncbi:MAG: DNA-3-methyladenine glycosylase 2 family protein [Candidatus Woesebacteria bacterium]|nr:MAG: DNA-3-methyladenine glycosylase 2 family protein [Candidatus Woesebacteria bacterium]
MWKDAEEFLQKDKYIEPLIRAWGHCTIKPIEKSKYFEDLVNAICSQQLSGKAAETIFGRVKKALNNKITSENLTKIDTEELRKCGLSYAKCSYVKDLALKAKSKKLKVKSLDSLADEEVVNELIQVKGIGRWTAEMFLMFSLGRQDVFPVDDLGIKKGFEKVIGKKWDKIRSAKFAQKHWSPYRTMASWYLWRSLENR